MHEEPQVLHFGRAGTGVVLREGMTFTIEPMLNQGVRTVLTEDDGWTVVTSDGKLSAPVRAYGGGDKGRRARAYPAPGRDAGALGEIVLRFALRLASPRLGEGDSVPSSFAPI